MLIKKYSNRRLYDTEESRYVTMEELADKIRRGGEPRIVDAKTDEDLTQVTLTQIIIEGRGASRLLPVPLLVQLIRMGDDALAEFFGRYVGAALDLYLQAKHGAQALAPINPLVNVPFAATSALARLLLGAGGGGGMFGWGSPEPAPRPTPPPPPVAPQQEREDVSDLRRELEALKKSLRGTVAAAKPRPKAKRKG